MNKKKVISIIVAIVLVIVVIIAVAVSVGNKSEINNETKKENKATTVEVEETADTTTESADAKAETTSQSKESTSEEKLTYPELDDVETEEQSETNYWDNIEVYEETAASNDKKNKNGETKAESYPGENDGWSPIVSPEELEE